MHSKGEVPDYTATLRYQEGESETVIKNTLANSKRIVALWNAAKDMTTEEAVAALEYFKSLQEELS